MASIVSCRPLSGVMSSIAAVLFACALLIRSINPAGAAEDDLVRTAGGITAYLGVVPAAIVKGPTAGSPGQPMHGGVPKGPHEYHLVVALFDAASNARISDATVTAQVSGLGLSGLTMKLEPMEIAGTRTYGGFVDLPGFDIYTIRLSIDRKSGERPLMVDFKYDHRR